MKGVVDVWQRLITFGKCRSFRFQSLEKVQVQKILKHCAITLLIQKQGRTTIAPGIHKVRLAGLVMRSSTGRNK